MPSENISVMKVRGLLLVTVPPDPDDETVTATQLGLTLGRADTALDVDRALDRLLAGPSQGRSR